MPKKRLACIIIIQLVLILTMSYNLQNSVCYRKTVRFETSYMKLPGKTARSDSHRITLLALNETNAVFKYRGVL